MPMKPERYAFLVRVLGEARTKALTDALPVMELALESAGVGWKEVADLELSALSAICEGDPSCEAKVMQGQADDEAAVVAVAVPTGPLTMTDAEAQQEVAEEGYEVESLLHAFRTIFDNIMAAPPEAGEKVTLLTDLLKELQSRLAKVGKGEKSVVTSSAASVYVDDLGAASGVKALDGEAATAIKELRESGSPAAELTAALLTGGAVHGGVR